MVALVEAARRAHTLVAVSALTVVETAHGRTDLARLEWILSRLTVAGVETSDAMTAVRLLRDAGGLHGHTHAIDALVAALALRLGGKPTVVTSDPSDWTRLVGDRVIIAAI
jgi:predicted nucleic acid-binding protein